MALVIMVDKFGEEPLFEQIRNQVVAAIATGDVRPGDALPSVRSLARDLGINLHTVNKAYATLRDEGFVIMLGRRGAFVADAASRPAAGLGEDELERRLARLATEFLASGGSREQFLAAASRAAAAPPGAGA